VGIFWYDLKNHSLFGVRKKELKESWKRRPRGESPLSIYPLLHRQIWDKEFFRAQAKHIETKFKGDYTQIPRGRLVWTIDKFILLVGKLAEPIQDELAELLKKEFSLPYFESVYDEHWNLGHGWWGERLASR